RELVTPESGSPFVRQAVAAPLHWPRRADLRDAGRGMTDAQRIDYEAEGLLADLATPQERASRVALLDELVASGVGLDALRKAVAERRLATLPLEHILLRGCDRTLREVIGEAGIGEDYARRHYLALGLPMPDLDEPA